CAAAIRPGDRAPTQSPAPCMGQAVQGASATGTVFQQLAGTDFEPGSRTRSCAQENDMTIDHEALLRTYFGNVNARNAPALAAMYASHGTLTLANGVRVSGRESIREFFETLFAQSPPGPQLVRVIGAGLACAAELLVTLADG